MRPPVPGSIALMQPYVFPYVGYLSLAASVETFVSFDSAQYIRRGWVNRNRVLHPTEGWSHLTIPVARHQRSDACDAVMVNEDGDWRTKVEGLLEVYRGAPHRDATLDIVREAVALQGASIGGLATHALSVVMAALGLPLNVVSSRALDLGHDANAPEDWGWRAAHALSANTYLNAPGGRRIYSPTTYANQGLRLGFVDHPLPEYDQGGRDFVRGLSIVDVLMWLGPDGTRDMVLQYSIDYPPPTPARSPAHPSETPR